ncbi:hypothetical protein [Cytobacillus purgationiresistens]|uniref:DNA-binding response OmpR family regulator n=1 Tax=Cytobacillus purgationiresistens TaxID=863449 RepID=A0ABU0APT6_9BACI|nr:hypothetical protein [Cytobacillus purgationiresistens]MDQ0272060.1 DNA-binding response OmpR family regulator [Cytobacillus purgationiresistens]
MTKLLIDDAYIHELVRLFLEKEGFEISEAEDGVQAVTKLEIEKFDIAILMS